MEQQQQQNSLPNMEYQQSPQQQWFPQQPVNNAKIMEVMVAIDDARETEEKFSFCQHYVEYGLADYILMMCDWMIAESSGNPNIATVKTQVAKIKTDYIALEAEVRKVHEDIHTKMISAGIGFQNTDPASGQQPTAYATNYGVAHYNGQQWGMHYQPGYQQQYVQQTHPSITDLGFGLAARMTGMPPPRPSYQPYQGY